jgi:hypothetical protein
MKRITIISTFACLGLALALAESPALAQTPAPPANQSAPQTAPALTAADQFTMNDYDSQITELLKQMVPLQQKRQAFVQALNASHPGWQWQDANQPGQVGHFVPIQASGPNPNQPLRGNVRPGPTDTVRKPATSVPAVSTPPPAEPQ